MLSLIIFITALIFSWMAVIISKGVVKEEAVKEALNIVEEYRKLSLEAGSKPRIKKKLRAMQHNYKRARNFILYSSLKKMVLLVIAYSISSLLVMVVVGTSILSPIYIPGLTIILNNHYYVPTVFIHFLGYIYALILFRKELII